MSRTRALLRDASAFNRLLLPLAWILIHFYAARPLLTALRMEGLPLGLGLLVVFALSALSFLPFQAGRATSLRVRSALHWIGYISVSLVATLLVLVMTADVFRSLYWAIRGMTFLASGLSLPVLHSTSFSPELLALAIAMAAVGLVQARRPRVRRVAIPIENLPSALDGFRIVQLSDVHVGPGIGASFVRSIVRRTNKLRPDLVAITGDLVDGYAAELSEAVQPLAGLSSAEGVYYVTGNHEYYWRASEWLPEIAALGIIFLKNDHRVIERGDARLTVGGVTDPAGRDSHKPDLSRAFAGAPPDGVRILLAHRPQAAQAASQMGVHLTLSGHTHGGQFFPFNLLIRFFQPIVAGLHAIGSTWLYVNRGTGYWGPPSRLGVGGEITLLELRSA
ncbi:MAG TPA: metallophosphoesterase [Thermoanaerobaculia bacterium]|nr:metallophosphoesterase [Thermoanaerobaculia bacterium]